MSFIHKHWSAAYSVLGLGLKGGKDTDPDLKKITVWLQKGYKKWQLNAFYVLGNSLFWAMIAWEFEVFYRGRCFHLSKKKD